MTVSEVRARLQAMLQDIEGVKKAFLYAPRVIQPSELPAFVTLVGPASYDMAGYGEDEFGEPRLYRMILFVEEVGKGSEGVAESKADPFIELVQDYFNGRPGLELDSEAAPRGIVFDAEFLGDEGIQYREYPVGSGSYYIAIEFRLKVIEIKDITYTSG